MNIRKAAIFYALSTTALAASATAVAAAADGLYSDDDPRGHA